MNISREEAIEILQAFQRDLKQGVYSQYITKISLAERSLGSGKRVCCILVDHRPFPAHLDLPKSFRDIEVFGTFVIVDSLPV